MYFKKGVEDCRKLETALTFLIRSNIVRWVVKYE